MADKRKKTVREALEHLIHLHSCEQEGIEIGKPTPQQWLDAVEGGQSALESHTSSAKQCAKDAQSPHFQAKPDRININNKTEIKMTAKAKNIMTPEDQHEELVQKANKFIKKQEKENPGYSGMLSQAYRMADFAKSLESPQCPECKALLNK